MAVHCTLTEYVQLLLSAMLSIALTKSSDSVNVGCSSFIILAVRYRRCGVNLDVSKKSIQPEDIFKVDLETGLSRFAIYQRHHRLNSWF